MKRYEILEVLLTFTHICSICVFKGKKKLSIPFTFNAEKWFSDNTYAGE